MDDDTTLDRLEREGLELAGQRDDDDGLQVALLALGLVHQIKEHFRSRAAEHGLSATEADALMPLRYCGPIAMGGLADELKMDPSNLTNLVGRLEARGLVQRQPDPADRRIKTVAVTAAGEALVERFKARLLDGNPAVRGLDDGEIQQLLGLLRRVVTGVPAPA